MNMYGYSEVRKLISVDLRLLCINEQWYTRGNSDEYYELLQSVDKMENVTTDNIVEIATDIYSHSDFEDYKADGYTMDEIIKNIMFKVGRICTTFFNED